MMMQLMQPNKSPNSSTTHLNGTPIVQDSANGAPSVAKTAGNDVGSGDSSPKIDPKRKGQNGSRKYSVVPSAYSPNTPIPHPHIAHQGHPPKLCLKIFPSANLK
jgi:hypothetical protein